MYPYAVEIAYKLVILKKPTLMTVHEFWSNLYKNMIMYSYDIRHLQVGRIGLTIRQIAQTC